MKYIIGRLIVMIGLAGCAAAAFGHHSTARFDFSKTETVTGTIKEFQWSNPHCYFQVLVPDGKGGNVEWSIEGDTPTGLARLGWTRGSLKPGDEVTITFAPMRADTPAGSVKTVTLPDGTVMSGMVIPPAGKENNDPSAPPLPTLKRVTK